MDKIQAYHNFWQSFQIPAYDETTVPDGAVLPYITYNVLSGGFEDSLYPTASLWYRGTSWEEITLKSDTIFAVIGTGGVLVPFDGGAVWIKRGQPFAQRMSDPDSLIRRIMLNLEIEYIEGEE